MPASRQTYKILFKRTSRYAPADLSKQIDTASVHIQQGLIDLANRLRNKMVENIESKRKRPRTGTSGWLGKHILVYPLINSVGIGDKNVLNARAPYWRVLNEGGYIPLSTVSHGVLGFFGSGDKPVTGGSGQNWTFTTGGHRPGIYFMKPSKPIKGIRYIEKAQFWLMTNLKPFWDNRLNKRNWAK